MMSGQGGDNGTVNNDINENKRQGNISSARFNLLSSMVGGGCLSLPLAFHQTGNLLVAPILLVVTSVLAQQSILFLVKAGAYSNADGGIGTSNCDDARLTVASRRSDIINNRRGIATYENVASQAFGRRARVFSMGLVCACCFFATVGYAVLLRDMLEPIVDAVVKPPEGVGGGPTLARNSAMLIVVLCISPLTTWENITALKDVGAASMASVFTVGLCVAYRSIECQSGVLGNDGNMRAFPLSMKHLLDAIPLFISSFVCHFNVLPIHNEMICPTSDRVTLWVRTSIWPATLFYYVIGFTGSLFVKCTASGSVQGNILLDFNEDDPLLLLGRLCLAVTIALAFPMLIIPPRDILVRSTAQTRFGRRYLHPISDNQHPSLQCSAIDDTPDIPRDIAVEFEPLEFSRAANMEEPLLMLENRSAAGIVQDDLAEQSYSYEYFDSASVSSRQVQMDGGGGAKNTTARKIIAFAVFWSAAGLACSVQSIDVVWDLVGSSFSIMLAFLIPCGAYLKLSKRNRLNDYQDGGMGFKKWIASRAVAWMMILVFVPLMVISTINACYNSFLSKNG
jgi:amino acid permease